MAEPAADKEGPGSGTLGGGTLGDGTEGGIPAPVWVTGLVLLGLGAIWLLIA
ncbi:MAG: hypothetical protein PHS60_04475 [Zavarzinia sp.]|nr:hypothetical protein [Zavarzinia sp.]